MTTKGKRRGGQPIFIKDAIVTPLKRISLGEGTFDENWIQEIIYNNPNILPVSEIETGFSPLIAIGREVSTIAGKIDNLFISPEGYLTIVETKLWRNPEARREVVGQIIDYAKELNKWTFADLDNSVRTFNKLYNNNSDGLLITVSKQTNFDETDEQLFIDNISRNLKRGRFLLLIIGDGVRESIEDMVEYLTKYPQLYFTLALIELQAFTSVGLETGTLIIPQLVTRTREITRAIVKIEGTLTPDFKINIETDLGRELIKPNGEGYNKLTIIAQDYLEQLEQNTNKETIEFVNKIIKDCEGLGLVIEWNTSSFTAKMPDPKGSGIKIAIFSIDRQGFVTMGLSGGQFKKLGLIHEIGYRFSSDTAAMLPGITPNLVKKHRWAKHSTLSDLQPVYDEFLSRVKKYIDELKAGEAKVAGDKGFEEITQ